MKRIFFSCLLMISMVLALQAAPDTTYEVDNDFSAPPAVAPTVNATNFVVNARFTIDNIGANPFKTRDTRNFTNTESGVMSAFFGFDLELWPSTGPAGPFTASTFYNGGEIDAGTFLTVVATNIANPGTISMDLGSKLKLTGRSIDLSRTSLIIADPGTSSFTLVDQGAGTCPLSNTLAYAWSPRLELLSNSATSSIFTNTSRQQLLLSLPSSTSYFATNFVTPSNQIIRAVFLENLNPAVGTRVFIGDDGDLGETGPGAAHIEWSGSYTDPASGNVFSNYLYLSDVMDHTTNPVPAFTTNGYTYLENFGFPLDTGAPQRFPGLPVFDPGPVTNSYAYIDLSVIAGSADTNSIFNGSITNLPGRMQISASHDLDLTLAEISSPNYLQLESTNQFNGNDGSFISANYADIRLGVTNGFMTVSNLWIPRLQRWNGPLVAWNTRWLTINTNGAPPLGSTNTITITNDYRALLVFSSLSPFAPTYVQDLWLHATNTLIISDTFNIIRSLYIDATSLTLTTNAYGFGANAADGELNLTSPNLAWATSLPRLRYLTNNGAIRISSTSAQNFGSGLIGSNYLDFINTGFFSDSGSTIYAREFLNSGTINNGGGPFVLNSSNTTVIAAQIIAGANITMSGQNMIVSNSVFSSKSLTLTFTNLLTDTTVSNGNFWTVGNFNGTTGLGFAVTKKAATGDLLGTTLINFVGGPNKQAFNIWAGENRGASVAGYSNNMALGRLFLDSAGTSSSFDFGGLSGMTNALYVDYLELRDTATNRDINGNFPRLSISNNLIIYYAQAVIDGASIAEKMNGKNNNHLIWVPTYAGFFSSTNLAFNGTTNAVNAALAQSSDIDSDGDGIKNASDSTPFFTPTNINLTITLTNVPPLESRLSWFTIPHATNFVYYSTNMGVGNWFLLTNFVSTEPYPGPATNVVLLDPVNFVTPRVYQVTETPWLTYPF